VKTAEDIRDYTLRTYIEPARRRGESIVQIRSGDVGKQMHLSSDKMPNICMALRTRKFQAENGLVLEKLEGPPKKMSSTVVFTFRLLETGANPIESTVENAFLKVRGIAKEAFQRLGGGEEFLKQERKHFYEPE
jgi:hypothetical protein